ncbi:exopolyphosphatase PRUNE1 [Discoglossus pictus]
MEHFLQDCKAALKDKQESLDVHVVIGNEACDLDSMVSAITLAYYLAKTSSSKNLVYVPVLNIPRKDFPLRTESTFLLKANGISEECLLFRDEIDIQNLYESGQLVLTLVDHNTLPRADSFMEDVVTEVIDHRPLERKSSHNCKMTAELVGSCATLIAEKILSGAPDILDLQIASLLRSTIVLDCVNMAPEAGKVTPKDTEIVTRLESVFVKLPPRSVVFDSLQKAKFDVSGLTTEQLLRKDLKALFSQDIVIAISAVYMKLEDFLQRSNLENDICSFCNSHGYNVLVAMAIHFNSRNEPVREIAVYTQQETLRNSVCRFLEEAKNPPLGLTAINCDLCHDLTAYSQENTVASRKKVLPILKEFLRKQDLKDNPGQFFQNTMESKGHWKINEQTDVTVDGNEAVGDVFTGDELKCKGHSVSFQRQGDDALEEENSFPPTPMNSLVEGCPLDRGLPKLTAEAIQERFSRITVVNSQVKLTSTNK